MTGNENPEIGSEREEMKEFKDKTDQRDLGAAEMSEDKTVCTLER